VKSGALGREAEGPVSPDDHPRLPEGKRNPAALDPDRGWYPADLVMLAYLAVTGILAVCSPFPWKDKQHFILLQSVFLAVVVLLHYARRNAPWPLHFFRHAYALLSLPFLYKSVPQVSRLTSPGYFDDWVVHQEWRIFGCQPSQILHSAIPWMIFSEFLHLTYLSYMLLVPVVALTLYLRRRFAALMEFTTTVLATFLFCYAVFAIFPVRGPFYYFGPIDPQLKGVIFPQMVHRMLQSASIGTAFPSSHVAAAVSIWLVGRRHLPKFAPVLFVIAVGIFVGTVYGGFHYAVDAIAGLAVGVGFGLLGPRLHAWICRLIGLAQTAAESMVLVTSPQIPIPRRGGRQRHA